MNDEERDKFLEHANIRDEIYLEWTTNQEPTGKYKGYISLLKVFYVGVGGEDTELNLEIPLERITRYTLRNNKGKDISSSGLEAISTPCEVEEL
ncbi:hypothetical protein CMI38_05375 [Candidatus Pacearchaeota archaeon]|jgi:hypothetical protein|nr:hypothetical protein [Candidatus Pacearchaeota archaeon]|tara:strand:- start:424 stop:705 length:282 start_codon:yes stop_codon:yes gene_type:complete